MKHFASHMYFETIQANGKETTSTSMVAMLCAAEFTAGFAKHQPLFNHTQTHPRTQYARSKSFPTPQMKATGESSPGPGTSHTLRT